MKKNADHSRRHRVRYGICSGTGTGPCHEHKEAGSGAGSCSALNEAGDGKVNCHVPKEAGGGEKPCHARNGSGGTGSFVLTPAPDALVKMYTGRPHKDRPPITRENFLNHLSTVTHHKLLVLEGCWKVGLYRQGLLHDLSKFAPTEFLVGARYFQGNRSPNNAERENIGYSSSWLHHKGRNRHHFEYWVDYNLRGKDGESPLVPVKMPGRYVVEMLMDRIAASKIYKGDAYTDQSPLQYFDGGRARQFMHPETAELLETLLTMLAEKGEEYTFAYVRSKLSK